MARLSTIGRGGGFRSREQHSVLHKGIHYDTGTAFRGSGYTISTRRADLSLPVVRRELTIIRDDLHANAVRVLGSDIARMLATTEIALGLGLEVWFSPTYFEYPPSQTTARFVAAAEAVSALESTHSGRVVFVAGSELTLFMADLIPGAGVASRLAAIKAEPSLLDSGRLTDYLAGLASALRSEFAGPLIYASLPFERVDWSLFDYVGVDHYRDARTASRYASMLEPFVRVGKPVIVTEFGMRTYRGAESSGTLGFGVTDTTRLYLHT